MSRKVEPELYCLPSPVLLIVSLSVTLLNRLTIMKHIFGAQCMECFSHTIGDSTHLNTEYWNIWPVVIIWFTKGQKKQCNCAGKLNVIPVSVVLLWPRYLSHCSHKTTKAAAKLLYVLCRWKESGTPEVARLQSEANCCNHPCKDYEGKATRGNKITSAKIITFMYKEESSAWTVELLR